MTNTTLPEGTAAFAIIGSPETEQDLDIMAWAFMNSFLLNLNCDPELISEMRFNMPYRQGGCVVRLVKTPEATARARFVERTCGDELWLDDYTGWCVEDYYTDSMTGPYWSPIFLDPEPIHSKYLTMED